jgi:hypothetical protein
MTALGQHPYPEETAAVPWFTGAHAVDVPEAAVVVPAEPTFTPLRRPGASLVGRTVSVPPAGRVTDLALLRRVRDGVENYTGPAAVVPPVEVPAAPSPEALLADERARYALADIVYAAAKNAEPPFGFYCPDCKATDSGWCDPCGRADEKAAGLYRLYDLILAADTYAVAAELVARSVLPPMVTRTEGRR